MTASAEYWDSQALTFDDEADHGLRDLQVRVAWQRLLFPLLPPAPANIADLGCGTGSLAVLLASAGHLVTGLDFAPAMVEAARAKAAAAGANARFLISDAAAPALAAQAKRAVRRHRDEIVLTHLTDPLLWGHSITDERYLLISRR